MSASPRDEHAQVGPWPGFALAAKAAVLDLLDRFGLDLWMVTRVDGEDQVVVASAGPWAELVPSGLVLPWARSFCVRMVARGGVVVERDVHRAPDLAPVAVGQQAAVRAYVGVPLLSTDGALFGSLCAYAGSPQPAALDGLAQPVQLLGRMLSSIVAGEATAQERSLEAAAARELADRDHRTGLRNRRGWEVALATEDERVRRYGSAASVLVIALDEPGDDADVEGARVLQTTCRPGDVLARTGVGAFGLLAVECDVLCARAALALARVRLRAAGVSVAAGAATRRPGEPLASTWRRAVGELQRDRRRRSERAARRRS